MSEAVDDFLAHYGIPGMKWGKRKANRMAAKVEKQKAKDLEKSQKEYDKKVRKNTVKAYNEAADYANEVLIPRINKKYEKFDFSDLSDPKVKETFDKYVNEYEKLFADTFDKKLKDLVGERPE